MARNTQRVPTSREREALHGTARIHCRHDANGACLPLARAARDPRGRTAWFPRELSVGRAGARLWGRPRRRREAPSTRVGASREPRELGHQEGFALRADGGGRQRAALPLALHERRHTSPIAQEVRRAVPKPRPLTAGPSRRQVRFPWKPQKALDERAVLASVPAGSGNGANLSDGVLDAVIDQRHIEPKHAVAKPLQCAIAARPNPRWRGSISARNPQ